MIRWSSTTTVPPGCSAPSPFPVATWAPPITILRSGTVFTLRAACGGGKGPAVVDRARLAELLARERATFAARHPESARAYQRAGSLFGRVPMTWMNMAAGGFPLYLDRASGARVTDVDGLEYADFSLGDTAAMAGHSPAPVLAAIERRAAEGGGLSAMMPAEEAEQARAQASSSGRSKNLSHSYVSHGTVDKSLIITSPAGPQPRTGNVGAPVDVRETSR